MWDSPGQKTEVGSLSLLQGIFPPQGSNPGLPHCRQILYCLSHQGSPWILEWVAYPFSRGASRPRNQTGGILYLGLNPCSTYCDTQLCHPGQVIILLVLNLLIHKRGIIRVVIKVSGCQALGTMTGTLWALSEWELFLLFLNSILPILLSGNFMVYFLLYDENSASFLFSLIKTLSVIVIRNGFWAKGL